MELKTLIGSSQTWKVIQTTEGAENGLWAQVD